jgi:hypothetical protein
VNGAGTDANAFTRDGERDVQRRAAAAGDALSAERDRFDVDVSEVGTQSSEEIT